MSDARVHRTIHEVIAAAPAGVMYGLIADATRWPLFFQPCVHVEQLDFDGQRERLRMWVTAGQSVKSWVSSRHLDVERLRVEFTHDLPAAPTRSMSGVWTVVPLGEYASKVTLQHAFTVARRQSRRAALSSHPAQPATSARDCARAQTPAVATQRSSDPAVATLNIVRNSLIAYQFYHAAVKVPHSPWCQRDHSRRTQFDRPVGSLAPPWPDPPVGRSLLVLKKSPGSGGGYEGGWREGAGGRKAETLGPYGCRLSPSCIGICT